MKQPPWPGAVAPDPAPRVIDEKTAEFVEIIDKQIADCESVIKRYVVNIAAVGPCFALESCDALLETAAEIGVWERRKKALTGPDSKATLTTIKEHAIREVMRHASDMKRSTSTTSRLAHKATGAAWADVLDKMLWAGVIDRMPGQPEPGR